MLYGYKIKDLEGFSIKFGSLLMVVGSMSYLTGMYLDRKNKAD
jgi:hypothetical protein